MPYRCNPGPQTTPGLRQPFEPWLASSGAVTCAFAFCIASDSASSGLLVETTTTRANMLCMQHAVSRLIECITPMGFFLPIPSCAKMDARTVFSTQQGCQRQSIFLYWMVLHERVTSLLQKSGGFGRHFGWAQPFDLKICMSTAHGS